MTGVWIVADVTLNGTIVGDIELFDNAAAALARAEELGVASWHQEVKST